MYMGANSNATLICTLVAAGICVLYSGTAIAENKNSIKKQKSKCKNTEGPSLAAFSQVDGPYLNKFGLFADV